MAHAEHRRTALVGRVAGNAVLQVLAGRRQRAKPNHVDPKGIVGDDRERGVVATLRQAQQGVPELARRVQLCPCQIKPPQPKQDRDQLLASRPPADTARVPGCRRAPPRALPALWSDLQGRAEGNVQGQCLLGPLRRLWQGLEQLDAQW